MAYVTTNPPKLLIGAFTKGSGVSIWTYSSADAAATIDDDGYVTNASALGMAAGDIVFVTDTSTTPDTMTTHMVTSITAGGAADLSDTGATLASADGD